VALINKAIYADSLAFAEVLVGIAGIQGINANTEFLSVTAGMNDSLIPFE
jgi:hypothetical protein